MFAKTLQSLRSNWLSVLLVAALAILFLVPLTRAALNAGVTAPQKKNEPACPASSPTVGPPTDMDQCKNDGWKNFNVPHCFKNQGDCVSYVETGK